MHLRITIKLAELVGKKRAKIKGTARSSFKGLDLPGKFIEYMETLDLCIE